MDLAWPFFDAYTCPCKAVRNGSWSNESSVDVTFRRYSRKPFSLELVRLAALLRLGIPGNAVLYPRGAIVTYGVCRRICLLRTHRNHHFPPHVTACVLLEHLISC
jgi:hypothetical protein